METRASVSRFAQLDARTVLAYVGPMAYEELVAALAPEREAVLGHSLYGAVRTLPELRAFMEIHVFAVWDFMSLLKTLQTRLTSITVPWTPPRSRVAARLVNAIVLGEESDTIAFADHDETLSHFELYLRAMREVGASTVAIDAALDALARGARLEVALEVAPAPARAFVLSTFTAIASPHVEEVAASFLFGREDLVPEMFRRLLPAVGDAPCFVRYLERHIEVDEGEHGPLARALLSDLCGNDPAAWARARDAARAALVARKQLWDGVG